MAIKVTRPITKDGYYYAAGTIIQTPTGTELSLARLWGWETVTDSPVVRPVKKPTKPELVQIAKGRGLDTAGLTKNELIDLLEE
jgi:hypothetical protein